MNQFDFIHKLSGDRKKAQKAMLGEQYKGKKKTDKGMEDEIPFLSVDGCMTRCKDGSTVVYLTYPGENLNLRDDRQQLAYAIRNAEILSGITADEFGIWLTTQETPVQKNLYQLDERINYLQRRIAISTNRDEVEHCRALLEVCQKHIRPEMQHEAISKEDEVTITIIGFKFKRADDKEIQLAVSNFASALEKGIGKKPELFGTNESLDLGDLFIKGAKPIRRSMGQTVIFPEE